MMSDGLTLGRGGGGDGKEEEAGGGVEKEGGGKRNREMGEMAERIGGIYGTEKRNTHTRSLVIPPTCVFYKWPAAAAHGNLLTVVPCSRVLPLQSNVQYTAELAFILYRQ